MIANEYIIGYSWVSFVLLLIANEYIVGLSWVSFVLLITFRLYRTIMNKEYMIKDGPSKIQRFC